MLKNYFKIALRNLWKYKGYSILNITGLALGMACCLLILLYIKDEKSYDKWLPGHQFIHRVAIDITSRDGKNMVFAPNSAPLAKALVQYPQVERAARILGTSGNNKLISNNSEKKFYESRFYWADPEIFSVFPYSFLAGSASTALTAPLTMVITKEMANKYFDLHNNFSHALGKTLRMDNKTYAVTGIIDNLPENSSFRPDFLVSLKENEEKNYMSNWQATMFYTYIKLKKGTNAKDFERSISHIADKYIPELLRQDGSSYRYFLQPLASIHLHSDLRYELEKNNSATYVNIFLLVAIFILLIACINFINLSTARATERAKEIGVRKVVGAKRWQLIRQFLCESILVSFFAVFIAFILVHLSLSWFNGVAEKHLESSTLYAPFFLELALVVTVISGLAAGIYPAWMLAEFRPVAVIKSNSSAVAHGGRWLRSALVIGQFAISIIIIVATIVVSRQLAFLRNQRLGFDKEQLLVISAPGSKLLKEEFSVVRQEFEKLPDIVSVCVSGSIPGRIFGNNMVQLKKDRKKATDMSLFVIDDQFLQTYNIPLAAGRYLSGNVKSDTSGDNVLINETALPIYGWKSAEDAIGQEFDGGWGTVVGVIKDFHFTSLQTKIVPLELFFRKRSFQYITVKVKTGDIQNTIASLEKKWKSLSDRSPFDYFFLNDDYEKQYRFESRLENLFSAFSLIALAIACLGLLGLAAYTTTLRRKEISIRKVLGATVPSIAGMLSYHFIRLVFVAAVVAIPVSWWAMNVWLEDFAYHITIGWWIFFAAAFTASLLAMGTISFQAIKAAMANPLKNLRSE